MIIVITIVINILEMGIEGNGKWLKMEATKMMAKLRVNNRDFAVGNGRTKEMGVIVVI